PHEFYMVRVAGLKQQQLGGVNETAADGMLPNEQIAAISAHVHAMTEEQHGIWARDILPCLQRQGLHLLAPDTFDAQQRTAARAHFAQNVFPALTPLAVDPGHPFPHLRNKPINVAVLLRREGRRRRKDPRDSGWAGVQVPARREVAGDAPAELAQALGGALKLAEQDIYRVRFPLQPADLLGFVDADPRPELRVDLLQPLVPPELQEASSMCSAIAARDILLHHPYESFDPVVRFIQEAAEDPKVLAIKQTLYRTSGDSPFVQALSRAAENGKQVTVLVEIKARFDEANNIAWARRLEDAGVHVVYGLIGLKTHCKIALVVRRE